MSSSTTGAQVGGPGIEPGPARCQRAVPPRAPASEGSGGRPRTCASRLTVARLCRLDHAGAKRCLQRRRGRAAVGPPLEPYEPAPTERAQAQSPTELRLDHGVACGDGGGDTVSAVTYQEPPAGANEAYRRR